MLFCVLPSRSYSQMDCCFITRLNVGVLLYSTIHCCCACLASCMLNTNECLLFSSPHPSCSPHLPFSSSPTCPSLILSVGRCYHIAELTSLTPVRRNATCSDLNPPPSVLFIILLGVSSAMCTPLLVSHFLDVRCVCEKNRIPDQNPTYEHVGLIDYSEQPTKQPQSNLITS